MYTGASAARQQTRLSVVPASYAPSVLRTALIARHYYPLRDSANPCAFSAHVNNEFASANSQRAQHASILCASKDMRFSAYVNCQIAPRMALKTLDPHKLPCNLWPRQDVVRFTATTKKTSKQLEILEKIWIIVNI